METTQLELFPEPEHVHSYELFQGPHKTQPHIPNGTGKGWCWTCCEWVDANGFTYWQRYRMENAS